MSLPAPGPVRTCVGCRQRAAKRELVRVVAGSDEQGRPVLLPDPQGLAPGRGAHVHPTSACFDLAVRRKAFTRALRVAEGLEPGRVAQYVAAREEESETPTVNNRPEDGARSS